MDCREARDFYSDYIESAPEIKGTEAHEHIAACPTCREEARRLGVLLGAMKKLPDEDLSPSFIVKVNEKIDALENKGLLNGVWAIVTGRGGWSKALATAATFLLVILGAIYFKNPPARNLTETADSGAAASHYGAVSESVKEVTQPPAIAYRLPTAPAGVMRTSAGTSPVQPVSFGSAPQGGYAPAPTANIADESPDLDPEEVPTATLSPAKTGSGVSIPNHIIIIKSEHPSDTTDQLRGLIQSSYGAFLAYSPEITFVILPAGISDRFLIALEQLGKITVVNAPKEKPDSAYYSYEVIVLPSNP